MLFWHVFIFWWITCKTSTRKIVRVGGCSKHRVPPLPSQPVMNTWPRSETLHLILISRRNLNRESSKLRRWSAYEVPTLFINRTDISEQVHRATDTASSPRGCIPTTATSFTLVSFPLQQRSLRFDEGANDDLEAMAVPNQTSLAQWFMLFIHPSLCQTSGLAQSQGLLLAFRWSGPCCFKSAP